MSDPGIVAAQIGREATMLGAWVQALATMFSAVIAGVAAYYTVLKPILVQRREKTEQILSLIMNSAHESWENSQETLLDIEKTQKMLDEFMEILAYCRKDHQNNNISSSQKCLKRGWVDISDSLLFEDMAREGTETGLSLNNHAGMVIIATNEMSKVSPKIALYCMNEDHTCRDLDLLGIKSLEILMKLRFSLAQLRFRRISFKTFAENFSEEMASCYAMCDQLDVLLKTYRETLKSSQKISAILEDMCSVETKNLRKAPFNYS